MDNELLKDIQSLLTGSNEFDICYDPIAEEARNGDFLPPPSSLHPELLNNVRSQYPSGLFRHQAIACEKVLSGVNTVVATRTSSGKSLIYSLPVLQQLLMEEDATALFLFPQKALANDQLQRMRSIVDEVPTLAAMQAANLRLVSRYDGATATDERPSVRKSAQILLTNPDMLHYSVLAWHEKHWHRFLSKLRYVIVDECHEYRGIFGTNVSYLFRRLRALCGVYGSSPTWIATSATVQSPGEHLAKLTGAAFEVVDASVDGSRQGIRKFWMVKPKEHAYDAGRKLTMALAEQGRTVLAFCGSRTAAEQMMARSGKDNNAKEPPFVRLYRAGLKPAEREEIEAGLKSKEVRAVFTTSALELGIDIGEVEIVICVGLPPTMMSLWQRAGRAGRAGKAGAIILIPGPTPIDAYYADHPQRLFDRENEPLILNLSNERVQFVQYACAVKEVGGDEAALNTNILGTEMTMIKARRDAGELTDHVFYVSDPHRAMNIRGAGDTAFKLLCDRDEIGDISPFHLLREAPRNGIYSHGGIRYRVLDVDTRQNQIKLAREFKPHFTVSNIGTSIRVKRPLEIRQHGRVLVAKALLHVNDFLRGVTEKHLNGKVIRSHGVGGMPNNWLPTEGTYIRIEKPLWKEILAETSEPSAKSALDTIARLFGSLFPTVTGPCESSDFDSAANYPKDEPPAIYLYDTVQYGVGIAFEAFNPMSNLIERSIERVEQCACETDDGCLLCVKNPHSDDTANKKSTISVLKRLQEEMRLPPVEVAAPTPSTSSASVLCKQCQHSLAPSAKFCMECGAKQTGDV